MRWQCSKWLVVRSTVACGILVVMAASLARADQLYQMQLQAEEDEFADWGHWGADTSKYSSWGNHSNRMVPVYTFGMGLEKYAGANSAYRDAAQIEKLYGKLPPDTLNPRADYFDQTSIYQLQMDAVAAGKKYVILIVFDGMDWQTTWAASIHKTGQVAYESGRGTGLHFQDYDHVPTDYGFMVTSAHNDGGEVDVNAQTVLDPGGNHPGGYSIRFGGATPWAKPASDEYLLGKQRDVPHVVTDSASSATSMCSGIKTYNAAINVDYQGNHVIPIARELQEKHGWGIGVVTSVPISHATPAAAYSNNVSRNDYQDLTRDLIGVPSISHRRNPPPGVDVLIGCGWGETADEDGAQGDNFVPGNKYLTASDLRQIDVANGGKYHVVQRTPGQSGEAVLLNAARTAYQRGERLFGFFGVTGGEGRKAGHLPYQTADGGFNPVKTTYSQADVSENPTLADMTRAALGMLSRFDNGFWLMVEAGDVDWANHSNNIDSSIGAVKSGDDAFRMVTYWLEKNNKWDDAVVILTADHGHYFVLDDPQAMIDQGAVRVSGGTR